MRGQGWIGRKDRNHVHLETVVLREDGDRVDVVISNASNEGCRLEADTMFRIGERVRVFIPQQGEVPARIRWALPGSAGTQFMCEVAYEMPAARD